MDMSITTEQPEMAERAQCRLALGTSLPGWQEPGEPVEGCWQAALLAPHTLLELRGFAECGREHDELQAWNKLLYRKTAIPFTKLLLSHLLFN